MATLRTPEEKSAIVARCIELEKQGGDILAYLWSENYLTPRATWCNIQREWLGRKPYEYTDGKPNKKKEKKKFMNPKQKQFTAEQKAECVRIAIEGGDPKPYIKSLGFKNPPGAWHNVKEWYRRNDPEMFRKIPDRVGRVVGRDLQLEAGGNYQLSVAETPEANRVTVAEVPEKKAPAPVKIQQPLGYDCFTVRGIEGEFGSYHYQDINGKQWIDYDSVDHANDLSMTVDQWRAFLAELTKAARVLGVEL